MSWYKTVVSGIDIERARAAIAKMPECFTPTGSRVYGGATANSDYDFVVNPKATWWRGEIMEGLLQSWTRSPYYTRPTQTTTLQVTEISGYVETLVQEGSRVDVVSELPEIEVVYLSTYPEDTDFENVGDHINLIFPKNQEDYAALVAATRIMKELKGSDRRRCEESKDARVLAFRVLRRMLQ